MVVWWCLSDFLHPPPQTVMNMTVLSHPTSAIPSPWWLLGHHTWFHNQFPPDFSVLQCPLGLDELHARPFPDVVFPPLPLSALSSSPFYCALQDGISQTWWARNMSIPLQFASLGGDQVFVWFECLLDVDTDFLVGSMVFVWRAHRNSACILKCSSYSYMCFDVLTVSAM